jgi:hypothetical protein
MQQVDNESGSTNIEKICNCRSEFINAFQIRFSDFQKDKAFELSTNLFLISIADLGYYPAEIQTEILDLRHHCAPQSKCKEVKLRFFVSFNFFFLAAVFQNYAV